MIKRTPRKDKISTTLPTVDSPPEEKKKNLLPRASLDLQRAREKVLTATQAEKEVFKDIIRQLITDPLYLINLQQRLREGKLAPAVEAYFWQFMAGKPTEQIEVRRATAVKIVHEFAGGEEVVIDEITGTINSNALERATDAVLEEPDTLPGLRRSGEVGKEHSSGLENH